MISLETVVAVAVQHPAALTQLGEVLRSDLVLANPFLRRVAEFADEFFVRYRKLPGVGDWEAMLLSLPGGNVRDGTREVLGRVLTLDTSGYTPEYFPTAIIGDLRTGAADVARSRLNALQVPDPDAFGELAKRVEAVQLAANDQFARLGDLNVWLQPEREGDRMPSGMPTLDRFVGGWGKELVLLFADSGVGKSIMLQNWAAAAAVRGKNILHVTLELALRPQIGRYYRQIAESSRAEVAQDVQRVRSRLEHWFRLAHGQVYLYQAPAYELTMVQLRRLVERAARAMDNRVDGIVLDYLDLCAPSEKSSRGGDYVDLGRLTHEARSLCPEFDVTVWTASQAVRRPQKAGRLTMKDMGDSYKKVQGTDILCALNQTDKEEEVYQGRLGLLKVRDSGGRGQEVGLYINRELALIAELTHPNTIQLMRRLGHLPEQLQVAAAAAPETAE